MARSKKGIRNVISFIIAFILMFSVIATIGVMFFQRTIINESTYSKILDKYNIYNQIYESIYEQSEYLLVINNIPKDVMKDVITKNEVIESVNTTIFEVVRFMKGNTQPISPIDTSIYRQRLEDNIKTYLIDNGIFLDAIQQSEVEQVKDTMEMIISADLQVINFEEVSKSSFMNTIAKLSSILNNKMLLMGLIVIDFVLIGLIFMIWKYRRVRSYAWVGYSLLSGGLIVFLLSYSGYLSKFYEYIIIATPYLANGIAGVIKTYLINMSVLGAGAMVIGIASMSVYWRHVYKRYGNV